MKALKVKISTSHSSLIDLLVRFRPYYFKTINAWPVFLLFAIMACSSEEELIKVVSFNVRFDHPMDENNQWSLRKSSVIDFLNYEQPDFIGLQEVLQNQLTDIKSGIPGYKWIGVGRDDGRGEGEFSPIFYNTRRWKQLEGETFWLSERPNQPSRSWDAALPRICTYARFQHLGTGKEISIFNTHFDHKGDTARWMSSEIIIDSIAAKTGFQRVVLLGDFNAAPGSKPIDLLLLDNNLLDSFSEAPVKYGQEGTFSGFDVMEIPKRRIDYVFCSSDIEVLKYTTDSRLINGRYLSDHFPVIVQLRY